MEMQVIREVRPSLQQISFELEQNSAVQSQGEQSYRQEVLSYSQSSTSMTPQSRKLLPISIQIDHYLEQSHRRQLPIIKSSRKYSKESTVADSLTDCLHSILIKAKQFSMEMNTSADKTAHFGSSQQRLPFGAKNRRSLSLQQDVNSNPGKRQTRSRTMANISVSCHLKQNQEQSSPQRKQLKLKLRNSPSKNQDLQLSNLFGRKTTCQFKQMFGEVCLAKKLTLTQNLAKEKKYLRKITEKRATVRHNYPKYDHAA